MEVLSKCGKCEILSTERLSDSTGRLAWLLPPFLTLKSDPRQLLPMAPEAPEEKYEYWISVEKRYKRDVIHIFGYVKPSPYLIQDKFPSMIHRVISSLSPAISVCWMHMDFINGAVPCRLLPSLGVHVNPTLGTSCLVVPMRIRSSHISRVSTWSTLSGIAISFIRYLFRDGL